MPKPVGTTDTANRKNHAQADKNGVVRKGTPTRSVVSPPNESINWIVDDLKPLTTQIDTLLPDPVNARIHPEKNMEAIRQSLTKYGQRTPLVVNRYGNVVIKGNGTLEAAKSLGWTMIAVIWVEDDPVTAAGYSLADNRIPELAKWDEETVTRLNNLLQEANQTPIGWDEEEIANLRIEDWLPPENPVDDVTDDRTDDTTQPSDCLTLDLAAEEKEIFEKATNWIREDRLLDGEEESLSDSACLAVICQYFLKKNGETN